MCIKHFQQFNWNIIPHSCHSRFCNACGVKYAKQLAAKATYPHRHIVFTIPEELRNWFKQDLLDSIYCLLLLETYFHSYQ